MIDRRTSASTTCRWKCYPPPKELVEIFKFPKENEQLLSSYAIDIRQPAQEQSIHRRHCATEHALGSGRGVIGSSSHASAIHFPNRRAKRASQRLLNGQRAAVLNVRMPFEGIDFETPACVGSGGISRRQTGPEREMLQAVSELDRPYVGTELSVPK